MRDRKGVFCLEGAWERDLTDKKTTLPVLELLQQQGFIDFIHRDVGTSGEFRHYLDLWADHHREDYALAYFAFHGQQGALEVAEDKLFTLGDLQAVLEDRCHGALIHFGSCSVLDVPERKLEAFLDATGARAVCGYREDVDWIECAALDLLLFYNLSTYKHAGTALKRFEESNYRQFAKTMKFTRYPR
jgi:hypothetical protein